MNLYNRSFEEYDSYDDGTCESCDHTGNDIPCMFCDQGDIELDIKLALGLLYKMLKDLE